MQKATFTLVFIIAVVFVLVVAKSLLIPLIIGMLFWYMIRGARKFLKRISWVEKYVGEGVQNILAFVMLFIGAAFLSSLLSSSIQELSKQFPLYQENLTKINLTIMESYGVNLLETLELYSVNFEIKNLVAPVMSGISVLFGDGTMVLLYCIFLLLEERIFRNKLHLLFDDNKRGVDATALINEIDESFASYLRLKSFISLITATISYFIFMFVGIDSPLFWSILIFLFNFIPSIGSLVATIFPALIAMVQFGEIMPGVWILVFVGALQLLVGNVIEPRLQGNSLNISPFVVILSLVVWGSIWGVIGMLLSVPVTVMMIMIFAKFESTKKVAILLSEDGDL